MNRHGVPRSYNIRTAQGNILQRNRHHLKYTNEPSPEHKCYREDTDDVPEILTHHSNLENDSSLPERIAVSSQQPIRVSRYGRQIRLPARLPARYH